MVLRTNESTAEAAKAFLESARARSQGVGGYVVGGHATGQPLDDVLRAFLLSDPKLEAWLVEQAEQFAELTAKERDARLKKLDARLKKVADVEKQDFEACKEALEKQQAAMEALEKQFAGDAA